MIAQLFKWSSSDAYCLAPKALTADLPRSDETGSWKYVKDIELQAHEERLSIDSDEALADIEQHGYHLLSGFYKRL